MYRHTFTGSGSGTFNIGTCGNINVVNYMGSIQNSINRAYVPVPYLSHSGTASLAEAAYSYVYQEKVWVVTNTAFGSANVIITIEYTKP